MAVDPEGSVAQLKGIGPKLQETLGRLGIFRLGMLTYLVFVAFWDVKRFGVFLFKVVNMFLTVSG